MRLHIIVDYQDGVLIVEDERGKELFCESREVDLLEDSAKELQYLLEFLKNSVTITNIEQEPEDLACGVCEGTGEGNCIGSSCYVCGGSCGLSGAMI